MQHRKIDPASRVWTVVRGADGRLQEQIDRELVQALRSTGCPEDVTEAVIQTAGEIDIAETRLW